jgi:hypothetical protein
MNKKIVGILICILLFGASVIPVIAWNDEYVDMNKITDDYNHLIKQAVESGLSSRDNWIEQDKLLASDGAADDHFGDPVSISGDSVIIGSAYDDDNGDTSGSAYIFIRNGTVWTEQAKLLASDGAADDQFGRSVSISGDIAIVGAQNNDDNGFGSGSAYIFTRTGTVWTEHVKLLASDGEGGAFFGSSVVIDGETAIIGARGDNENGFSSGSAYIFIRNGTVWTEQAKLLASDGAADDQFGDSVSISGDTAIIGARADDDNGDASGSAYIFIRNGTVWTEQAKLLASDGAADDYFGWSISISGDTAIVGAEHNDDYGNSTGSAYIFKREVSSWTEETKLLASDGAAGENFGSSVFIDGDYAIIGTRSDDDNGYISGSAYVFIRIGTTWTEQTKLLPSDGMAIDRFGISVSIDGDTALIGAYLVDDNGENSGSAYIFVRNPPPNKPNINGPNFGKTGTLYAYSIISEDPDDEDVFYEIDWDDGSVEPWDGPYESNTFIIKNHTWEKSGIYFIRARAKDVNSTISEWETHMMIIFKSFDSPFLNFLQDFLLSHPNLLIILRLLFRMFGLQ